jgi:hypothetical protein
MFTESESGSQVEEKLEEDLQHQETFRTPTPIMAPAFITKIKDARAQRGHQAIFECVVPDTKGWVHFYLFIDFINWMFSIEVFAANGSMTGRRSS